MIKATPELEAKIKASRVPVVEITLQQFLHAKLATEEEISYIYNKHNKDSNNGNTSIG